MVSPAHGLRPAVFLDRDGVIVVPEFRDGRSFAPRRREDFRLYPDAAASLQKLKQAGFLLAVITNQTDGGDGLIAPPEMEPVPQDMGAEIPPRARQGLFPRPRRALRLPQAQAGHDPRGGRGTWH